MTIQYVFTPHNTIRIECGNEVIEVALPSSSGAPAAGGPGHARGGPIGVGGTPRPGGRPRTDPGVMAIIGAKKGLALDFDWTKVEFDLHWIDLNLIGDVTDDDDLAQVFKQHVRAIHNAGNGTMVANVGVVPWSKTTPQQLENLRRIVESPKFDIGAVRLFQLPDGS